MCLLIKQPKGLSFTKAEIRDFHNHNSDGFGFMYGDGQKLHSLKLVGSPKDVLSAYYRYVAGREAVLHFRQATHGSTRQENAHPFEIVRGIMLAHNGILSLGNPVHADRTDTEHLVEFFIRPVAITNPDLLFDKHWGEMLGKLIGSSNKLAIAHKDGRIAIINEDSGTEHKGAWMSNTYAWTNTKGYRYSREWEGSSSYVDNRSSTGTKEVSTKEDTQVVGDENVGPTKAQLRAYESLERAFTAYTKGLDPVSGLQCLISWVTQYPFMAAVALVEFYQYDSVASARDFAAENPVVAADQLAEAMAELGYINAEGWPQSTPSKESNGIKAGSV